MTHESGYDWNAIEKDKRFIRVERELQKLEDAGCNIYTGMNCTDAQEEKLDDLRSERDSIIEEYPDLDELNGDSMFGVKPSKNKLL